jgi:hypothetical protein
MKSTLRKNTILKRLALLNFNQRLEQPLKFCSNTCLTPNDFFSFHLLIIFSYLKEYIFHILVALFVKFRFENLQIINLGIYSQ